MVKLKRTYSEVSHAIELAAFDPDGYNLECKRHPVLLLWQPITEGRKWADCPLLDLKNTLQICRF